MNVCRLRLRRHKNPSFSISHLCIFCLAADCESSSSLRRGKKRKREENVDEVQSDDSMHSGNIQPRKRLKKNIEDDDDAKEDERNSRKSSAHSHHGRHSRHRSHSDIVSGSGSGSASSASSESSSRRRRHRSHRQIDQVCYPASPERLIHARTRPANS